MNKISWKRIILVFLSSFVTALVVCPSFAYFWSLMNDAPFHVNVLALIGGSALFGVVMTIFINIIVGDTGEERKKKVEEKDEDK